MAAGERFTGLVGWNDGLVASSSTGAWHFDGSALHRLRDNFAATGVQAVGDRLYLIETEQPDGPA